jgi:putative hydrolase of the HAD superfamily
MALRAVLWDFDDTLIPVHTPDRWQWAWKPQGPRLNERHVRASIREGLRRWDRRRWQGLVGDAPPADDAAYHDALRDMLWAIAGRTLPEHETEAVIARFPKYPGPIEPFADVRPCLEALHTRGLKMAVLVGHTGSRARELLGQLHMLPVLPQVFGETAEEPRTPAAEAFKAACGKLEVESGDAAFVGDLFWSDVRAAGRAGLRGILVDRLDWWSRVEASRIPSLLELPHLLFPPVGTPAAGPPGAAPESTAPQSPGSATDSPE